MQILSILLMVLLTGPLALAEDVEPRTKLPSTLARIRGASSVVPVPWGYVALGGSALRHLPKGKTQWETLLRVPGDSLYRIDADKDGRLLAAWEGEAQFHLFLIPTQKHFEFPKPPKLGKEFRTWTLDDIYFDDNGDAIVYMNGLTGNCVITTVAYRYPLDGRSGPRFLYQQEGHEFHTNHHLALYAYSTNHSRGCDYNGCSPLSGVYLWEIHGNQAVKRVLLESPGDEYSIARLAWGSDDQRGAVFIYDRKNVRHLLRWRYGTGKESMRPLPKGPGYDIQYSWVTKSDDVIEAWSTDDYRGLEIRRYSPGGAMKTTLLNAGDKRIFWDTRVYTLKERKDGSLFMHWGDRLVLLYPDRAPRALYLQPLLKRKNEWAGAGIYVPEPEALWLGVDIAGGRDFLYLSFEEIEKKAKPLSR